MKRTKEQKGITLVALIITIVVLLILAVVAITAITETNIIENANMAANKFEQGQLKEDTELKNYDNKLNDYIKNESRN